MKRWIVAITLLAVGAAAMFLLFRDEDPPRVPVDLVPHGEIAVAYQDEPVTLNPFIYAGDTNATRDLLRPVFPTLLAVTPDMKYGPELATRVPFGKDITREPFAVTFHLDPKAVWADGSPVTAHDVRFTWQAMLDPAVPIANRLPYRRITDAVVMDDRTVRLVFDAPYPAWRDLFSAGSFVLPKHALVGRDLVAEFGLALPGAGPFVIESYEEGHRIVYKANPRWWGRGPGLERVTVYFVPSIDTALRLLDQNRVQVVAATTQLNLTRRLQRIDGVKSVSRFGSAWWELGFNHSRERVGLPGFRQAVARGIDRASIVEALIRGEGRALQNLRPGSKATPAFGAYRFDPSAAREGSSGAGSVGLSAPEENEVGRITERAIFEGLTNAGLEVEIRNSRAGLFYGSWRKDGNFDLALWEMRGSPSRAFASHYLSNAAPDDGLNYYRLASSEVDRAVEAAERAEASRDSDLNAIMELLASNLPALPIFEAKAFIGLRAGISGPAPNATVDGPFWNMERWAHTSSTL